jgi:hypothetical protein
VPSHTKTAGGYRNAPARPAPLRPAPSAGTLPTTNSASRLKGLNIPGVQKGFVQSPARNLSASALKNMYKAGDRVRHLKFGEGTVVDVSGSGNDSLIKIEFTAYGVKTFKLVNVPIVKMEE